MPEEPALREHHDSKTAVSTHEEVTSRPKDRQAWSTEAQHVVRINAIWDTEWVREKGTGHRGEQRLDRAGNVFQQENITEWNVVWG